MIKINRLTKQYGRKTLVFKNFNYVIDKNLFLVIGSNGSGKTTLLNCIANYIKYKGRIEVQGKMSYLPEYRGFEPDVIVKDLINLIKTYYKADASNYIKQFKFEEHLRKKIGSLSKGNATKLYLICTLVKPADIYLFDEPTDGLDIGAKKEFVSFCKALSKKHKVIVSTHDFGVIDRLKKGAQLLNLDKIKKCYKK